MWYKFILISSCLNGIYAFGPRVLQGWGLSESFYFHYMALWYGCAAVVALAIMLRAKIKPTRGELIAGLVMGTFSLMGLGSLMRALQLLDGSVVYSGEIAGEITLVGLIGMLAFREKVGPCGIAGIISGMLAVILLTVK